MKDDLDLVERLAEIPDPFADAGKSPARRIDRAQMPPSPSRSQVQRVRAAAVAVALLYDAAWPLFFERRADLSSLPSAQIAAGLAIPLIAAGLSASAARRAPESGMGEPKERILTLVIASPALFAAATLLTAPGFQDDRFWRHAVGCMLVTAMLAAGPLALAAYAFRRAFVALSGWRTAALGVASGALAAATMSLACPISAASHVLVGHGAVMLFAGALGGLLGPRLCRA